MVTLTSLHIAYIIITVAVLAALLLKKEIVLPCALGILVIGYLYQGSIVGAVQTLYKAIINSCIELLGIIVVIALVVAMSRAMVASGADQMLMRPVCRIIRTRNSAFWAFGFAILIMSWLIWPSPAVAHHLNAGRSEVLMDNRREGKEVYYRAADTKVSQLLHQVIEMVMEYTLCQAPPVPKEALAKYRPEQVAVAQAVHDQLMDRLDQRVTIEDLARQHLMNPTTLKTLFRAVYGNSIAAHMKEHRMERAADLLAQTEDSIAQIARAVGYENQSKFTTAFKEYWQMLPTEYRKCATAGTDCPKTACPCCKKH